MAAATAVAEKEDKKVRPVTSVPPVVKAEDAPARVARLKKRLGFNAPAITLVMLTELNVDGTAYSVLYPLIVDRVHHLLREMTRNDFNAAQKQSTDSKRQRAGGKGTPRPQAVKTPELDNKLAFMEFKVVMAGVSGGFKLYKNLTVEEHAARCAMMTKTAAPMLHSARSHEWAKGMCERHKVKRLADISVADLLKELPKDGVRP